jgi:hypothetical protein
MLRPQEKAKPQLMLNQFLKFSKGEVVDTKAAKTLKITQ